MLKTTNACSFLLVLGFLFVYLGWGSNYVVIKLALEDTQPLILAGTRGLIAGPCLVAIALAFGQSFPRRARDWLIISVSAFFILIFASAGVTWAQQWVDAGTAAIVVASSAIWLTVLGSIGPRGDPLRLKHWVSVVMGLLGMVLVLGHEVGQMAVAPMALAVLLLAALALASGSLLMRRYPVACGSMMAAGIQTCLAGLVLVPLALLAGERMAWQPNLASLGALLYLSFIGTGFSYVIYCWLAANSTPSRLATVSYVTPAVAIVLAQIILHESLTLSQLSGSILITFAIILLLGRKN